MSDARRACTCAQLEREVAALERLVGRYQRELVASASCRSCGKRAHESLPAEDEELFESQLLDALRWEGESGAEPQVARRCGQHCDFAEVPLPSSEWIWTSDWRIDVSSMTDENGWTYAFSRENLDSGVGCHSNRRIGHSLRRRRWLRQRKFIGSSDLPHATRSTLENEAQMGALRQANEKLTDQLTLKAFACQLRRANDQIAEYEARLRAYEAKLLEMQHGASSKRPSRIFVPLKHDSTATIATPFSPSKSREVLNQTEALLTQMLGTTEPALLDDATREAQRRRSEMVIECQSELDGAVTEFHSLVQTLDSAPRRAISKPTSGA